MCRSGQGARRLGVVVGFGRSLMWANGSQTRTRGGGTQRAFVALPIRAAGRDNAAALALAVAATSSPVSQQKTQKKRRWISVKAKLASFGHKIRQMRRRRERKEGAGHVPARKGHPSIRTCCESYGGTSTLPCSRSAHCVRVQVPSHYARDTAGGTAPTLSLAVLLLARSSTCRVPSALWLLYSLYRYADQRRFRPHGSYTVPIRVDYDYFSTSCQQSVRLTGDLLAIHTKHRRSAWLALTKLDAAKSVCALATAHLVASWATVLGCQQ